jgi:tyramine---L-glutamate ligase
MTHTAFTVERQKRVRVLVAEFLLANTAASRLAAGTMLAEARAMLTAIVTDLSDIPNVAVTVLLAAENSFLVANRPTENIRILRGELRPEILSKMLCDDSQQSSFDAVLLIAPECDGVLVSLLKTVQQNQGAPTRSLNLDWQLAEIFADKQATDSWLRQHGIATIPTKTLDDAGVETLLKPRDGAGAAGTQILEFCRQDFFDLPQQSSGNDRWVLQPFLPGIPCSIGFIGGGQSSPTTILPPGWQNISTHDLRIAYCGGQIPCEPMIAARIAPVAEQLADALGTFNGYVGADLLVDCSVREDSENTVRVVEINPRLCTSYVGYRALAVDSLAALILQQQRETQIRWKPSVVKFSADGTGIDIERSDG